MEDAGGLCSALDGSSQEQNNLRQQPMGKHSLRGCQLHPKPPEPRCHDIKCLSLATIILNICKFGVES